MKRHHVVCGFVVLFVLLATTQTQAKTQINLGEQGRVNKRVVFVNRDQFLRMANNLGLTIRELKVSKDILKKLRNVSVKGCGCSALADEAGGGFSCFKGCLQDWGVSYSTVIGCAGLCEDSLVGCAACVGVGEWIVMGCSLYCAWKPLITRDFNKMPLTPNLRRSQTDSAKLAKLSSKRTHPGVAALK